MQSNSDSKTKQTSNIENLPKTDTKTLKNDSVSPSRREFLMLAGACSLVATSGAFIPQTAFAEDAKESDPMAKQMCYHADGSKVDKKVKGCEKHIAKQTCSNCIFYQTAGKDPKTVKSAPCPIMQNKNVAGTGWCSAWVVNPKA